MPSPLYNADNVVVGQAMLMLCPWIKGTPTPLPPDNTPIFDPAAWPTPWVGVGGTSEGFSISVDASTANIMIEEQTTPVDVTLESKGLTISAALVEDTLKTIQQAFGGGTISATASKASMFLSDDVTKYTAALEMRNANGFARRIYVPKTSNAGGGEVAFRRAADKRSYPVTWSSICPPGQIQIVDLLTQPV